MEVNLEANLALSEEDSSEQNITLDWSDVATVNPDLKEEAVLAVIGLGTILIILLFKQSAPIFSFSPIVKHYVMLIIQVRLF